MENTNNFQIGDRVIHIQSQREKDIIEIEYSFDVDLREAIPTGRYICTWIDEEKGKNVFGSYKTSELELIEKLK